MVRHAVYYSLRSFLESIEFTESEKEKTTGTAMPTAYRERDCRLTDVDI